MPQVCAGKALQAFSINTVIVTITVIVKSGSESHNTRTFKIPYFQMVKV
jgi:hypothetical protein